MNDRHYKILLVEPDPDIVEILVAGLARRFDAHITCVATANSCLDVEMENPHDLVIADLYLPDSGGLDLAEKLRTLSHRPIILMGYEPSRDEALAALRLKVQDLFVKPFPVTHLIESVERSLAGYDIRRQHQAKYRHMRNLVRRVLRERRELNRRIELICRDLVGAHRRLVHRVLDREQAQTHPPA